MKKTLYIILCLFVLSFSVYSVEIELGINYGGRSVSDSTIKDIYGNGSVYYPHLNIKVWQGLMFGVGYEGGYDQDGKLDILNVHTTLNVKGFDLYIGYEFKINSFAPYIKLSYSSYSFEQTIDHEYFTIPVKGDKNVLGIGGGLKFYVTDGLFVGVDLRYIPLKVNPVEVEIDLSGLRYSFLVGYSFKL